MPQFSQAERSALLALKGIGPTVVGRIEEMGIATLAELARRDPDEICAQASAITGSTCWRNSPQALAAISTAVRFAQGAVPTNL